MTEMDKKREFVTYLEENIWSEAERVGRENNNMTLVKGIRLTRIRITQLPTAEKMVHYFWSAIYGTDKSINFSEIMKEYGLTRFEDVLEEVRTRFNDDWLRA